MRCVLGGHVNEMQWKAEALVKRLNVVHCPRSALAAQEAVVKLADLNRALHEECVWGQEWDDEDD